MPRKKTILKSIKRSETRRQRNKNVKSNMRTAIKKLVAAIDSNDAKEARQELEKVIPAIDSAATKGVIHRNNASRKISRLTRKVGALTSGD